MLLKLQELESVTKEKFKLKMVSSKSEMNYMKDVFQKTGLLFIQVTVETEEKRMEPELDQLMILLMNLDNAENNLVLKLKNLILNNGTQEIEE